MSFNDMTYSFQYAKKMINSSFLYERLLAKFLATSYQVYFRLYGMYLEFFKCFKEFQ